MKTTRKNQKAQTAIELAVFGSILIFVIGLIVRQTLGTSYAYNINLKAMRLAMLTSFRYSEGLVGYNSKYFEKRGSASRNTASVLILEDRLSVSSGKYATIDRTPLFASASATHSRHLMMNIDAKEYENLPTTDFYINGKHFPLTVARLRKVNLSSSNPPTYYSVEINHEFNSRWCNCTSSTGAPVAASCGSGGFFRFDLDRDGILDPVNEPNNNECEDFSWQWRRVAPKKIDVDDGKNVSIDLDGDLETETVVGVNVGFSKLETRALEDKRIVLNIHYMDFQEGDIDVTIGNHDSRPQPGFTSQDLQLYTFTKANNTEGTYLLMEEGKLFSGGLAGKQFVRTVQKKDSIDIVQRTLQLSNDTGRFCTAPGEKPPSKVGKVKVENNPVEVCCQTVECCFVDGDPATSSIDKTCMVTDGPGTQDPIIFVRSRIHDKSGRKWITLVDGDPYIFFQ